MLKLIYLLFKKRFNYFAFNYQSKKLGFENLEKAFIDSKGMAYYRYKNDFEIPIIRFKEIQQRIILLNSGLSDVSLKLIASKMKEALNGGKKSDLAEIGFLIKEIERRANIWIDTDMLMEITALTYIREDESTTIIDWVLHKEKIIQFTKDSAGGLYDFFYSTGLISLLPFAGTTEEEFQQFYKESELKMKALKMTLEASITG